MVEIQQEAVLAEERITPKMPNLFNPEAMPAPAGGKIAGEVGVHFKPNWKIRSLFVTSPWPADLEEVAVGIDVDPRGSGHANLRSTVDREAGDEVTLTTPSPEGNADCGVAALLSPSNALPTGSTRPSNTVNVKRSSGSGWANSSTMWAVASSPATRG